MGTKYAQALLLPLAAGVLAGILNGVGSASQVILPDGKGIESLSGITDSEFVICRETDGRDSFGPITELDGESFVALEDSQKFLIESRKYSSKISFREISSSKSHSFPKPKASSRL